MLELIVEMPDKRGCSIVLSTHLLPDVDRVCDQVVIMHQGRVRFSGDIETCARTSAAPTGSRSRRGPSGWPARSATPA